MAVVLVQWRREPGCIALYLPYFMFPFCYFYCYSSFFVTCCCFFFSSVRTQEKKPVFIRSCRTGEVGLCILGSALFLSIVPWSLPLSVRFRKTEFLTQHLSWFIKERKNESPITLHEVEEYREMGVKLHTLTWSLERRTLSICWIGCRSRSILWRAEEILPLPLSHRDYYDYCVVCEPCNHCGPHLSDTHHVRWLGLDIVPRIRKDSKSEISCRTIKRKTTRIAW